VPGVHYVAFDDAAMLPHVQVPANATVYRLPLILLRDASLQDETVTLDMRIVENEEFKVGIDGQSTFRVNFSDQYLPTSNWRPGSTAGWHTVFGEYGSRKHWFIVTYVGFTDFEGNPANYPLMVRKYYNARAREKLTAYNAANPVLTEANGQTVSFPTI
jgi:hypothetical protein